MNRTAGVALALLAIVAGVAGALIGTPWADDPQSPAEQGPQSSQAIADATLSIVATAIPSSVVVYELPNGAVKTTLANPTENGAPLTFLEQDQTTGWVKVLLPIRPNGATGWVKVDDVRLSSHHFKIRVELGKHRLVVTDRAETILDTAVGIGKDPTPTPGGIYYTKELLQPPDPNGAYGHYAYTLSGFSDVLFNFAGGNGELGLHGTNDPSGLGTDVSHGCLRISNEAIDLLAGKLPLGVPVEIVA